MSERTLAAPDETRSLGRELAAQLRAGDVVVLVGPMGAGKTTLTRGLAEALGVQGRVQSPSFVIVHTHPAADGGLALAHVDAQRLGDHAEFEALELEDALAAGVVVVEWGEGHVEGLGTRTLTVRIEPDWASDVRRVSWEWAG
ncbi:YjeE family ATPase [Segniliparus rugosus ATCC BAA-974]|uniref:tRNA threonylcarbamoyladenosine biosynthesis protein TsaE n=2 Tax=Segniliparus rugosus TaxID=286804 RepID=E5XQM1_SEGRC|nr:YjeE family ATPase [Segniliparus rugosus ATCC BAA-974]